MKKSKYLHQFFAPTFYPKCRLIRRMTFKNCNLYRYYTPKIEFGDDLREILEEAAEELALSVKTVIRKLNLQRTKFPLVLVRSVFNSKIILKTIKKEIKNLGPGRIYSTKG